MAGMGENPRKRRDFIGVLYDFLHAHHKKIPKNHKEKEDAQRETHSITKRVSNPKDSKVANNWQ